MLLSSPLEQLLRDSDHPAEVHSLWRDRSALFLLRLRTSCLMRIYHSLDGDYQTFHSVIVTHTMTTRDLVRLATASIAPEEQPEQFHMIVKTPHGGRPNWQCDCASFEDVFVVLQSVLLVSMSTHCYCRREQHD